jgi:FkbM family methyltransferase
LGPQLVSKLAIKIFVQRMLRRLGWELQRFERANVEQQVLTRVLRLTGADVVLDVGANTGQYGDLLFETGFQGTLISFEAIPSVHQQLSEHAKGKRRSWLVAPCAALGSKRGQININVSANSVSSSVLPMLAAHLDVAPHSRYVGKQWINVERLEVLKGATGLLQRVAAVQLELSLTPLYEGGPTFLAMVAFMASAGFELFGIVPEFTDERSGRLLQVDGFFVRCNASSEAEGTMAIREDR